MPTTRRSVKMTTKQKELEGHGILSKAQDDEPLFILRAQDVTAAATIEYWIKNARSYGVNMEKLAEAERIVVEMRQWPNRKVPD